MERKGNDDVGTYGQPWWERKNLRGSGAADKVDWTHGTLPWLINDGVIS